MIAIGLSDENVVDLIKTVGQTIIDRAEEIAPKSNLTRSVRIVGEIVAGDIVRLHWSVEKYVSKDGKAVLFATEDSLEVGET